MAVSKINPYCFLTALLSILLVSICCGQEIKKIENVKGEWILSNDITPVQARENAINNAKIEALRRAGVPEVVGESTLMYKSERGMQQNVFFESLSTIDVFGEISEMTIVKEVKRINEFDNLIFEVWINATVKIHKNGKDPGFRFEVNGLRETYTSPDKLIFDLLPLQSGYLTVFILDGQNSGLIFPNQLEKQEKLEAHRKYSFPTSKALDYEVTANTAMEVNYLLILYTKREISFVGEPTAENIIRFVARIDPSEKHLKSHPFLVKK